jgi:transcriptional regulator with XRE-family HTH domain
MTMPVIAASSIALGMRSASRQEKLALLADVDRSYVGRIERGDNNAAVLTLARLAAALNISVAKLMQKAAL